MRKVLAAIAIALLTAALALHATPSAAQKGKKHRGEAGMKAPAKKADDKAYKAAIEGLPDQKLDPWRNMR
jgi:hypothetical protein